jgi:hypothetical protein
MDSLNDLKTIWLSADTKSLPNSNEIKRMSKKFRDQKLIKKVALIAAAILLTALMVAVVFIYKSTMLTTRLGEGCLIIAGGILVYTNINSIGRFYRFKDHTNKEFIQFLEQTRLNQIYYHKKTQVAGLAFCSVGLLLYIYEFVHERAFLAVIAYSLMILYLLVLWLIVRPRVFRKQTLKLNETINKLERLSKQL